MKIKADKILKSTFILLSILLFVFSVKFIITKDKWSPIDEYAHMDYIEKLSEGQIPKLSDTLSEELFEYIKNNPNKNVSGPIKNRADLGYGNNSYQAKHPPLYYAILVIPNLILKKMRVGVFARVITLRLISFLLFVLGSYLCIPIFRLLKKLHFELPHFYGWMCFSFSLLICTHERYGLGNNLLSPLLINGALYLFLTYEDSFNTKYLYGFIVLICLSILSSLSNVLIAPFLFLFFLYRHWRRILLKNILLSFGISTLIGMVYVTWKTMSAPDKLFEDQMNKILAFNMPPGLLDYKTCLELLLGDTFQLSFIKGEPNISSFFVIGLSVNILLSVFYIREIKKKHLWLLLGYCMLFVFALEFYILNKYVGIVTWIAFRHYLGFIPILFIASTGILNLFFTRLTESPDK